MVYVLKSYIRHQIIELKMIERGISNMIRRGDNNDLINEHTSLLNVVIFHEMSLSELLILNSRENYELNIDISENQMRLLEGSRTIVENYERGIIEVDWFNQIETNPVSSDSNSGGFFSTMMYILSYAYFYFMWQDNGDINLAGKGYNNDSPDDMY